MTQRSDTALFAGSFRPFTRGHQSIVDRTLQIADRVVIGIGRNVAKDPGDYACRQADSIRDLYREDPRVDVRIYEGLTVDFARECGAGWMVRGVRSAADFEYERNLAEINLRISGIETLLMPALPEYSCISSSAVRELEAFGHDVSEFLPLKK